MKKLFTLCLLAFVAIAVNAQFGKAVATSDTANTVINTATKTKYITCTAGYTDLVFQYSVTKISGTVAGVIRDSVSIDGTKFFALGDTMNVAPTNMYKLVAKTAAPYYLYKFTYTGTGTMAATWKVYYILRKRPTQ